MRCQPGCDQLQHHHERSFRPHGPDPRVEGQGGALDDLSGLRTWETMTAELSRDHIWIMQNEHEHRGQDCEMLGRLCIPANTQSRVSHAQTAKEEPQQQCTLNMSERSAQQILDAVFHHCHFLGPLTKQPVSLRCRCPSVRCGLSIQAIQCHYTAAARQDIAC